MAGGTNVRASDRTNRWRWYRCVSPGSPARWLAGVLACCLACWLAGWLAHSRRSLACSLARSGYQSLASRRPALARPAARILLRITRDPRLWLAAATAASASTAATSTASASAGTAAGSNGGASNGSPSGAAAAGLDFSSVLSPASRPPPAEVAAEVALKGRLFSTRRCVLRSPGQSRGRLRVRVDGTSRTCCVVYPS